MNTDQLKTRIERAERLLANANADVEAAKQALRECGIDPEKNIDAQLKALEGKVATTSAKVEKLGEELDALFEGL